MAKVRKLTNEDKSTLGKVLRYIRKYYVFLFFNNACSGDGSMYTVCAYTYR